MAATVKMKNRLLAENSMMRLIMRCPQECPPHMVHRPPFSSFFIAYMAGLATNFVRQDSEQKLYVVPL